MSINKEKKDFLYLIWIDSKTKRRYVIGMLSKNIHYEFCYGFEVEKAQEKGFKLLISFDEIDKVYKSDILFPVFSSRLPDKKRREINKILTKYGMNKYNDYELLKKSGARLPIDNLEFMDHLLEENKINTI